MGDPGLKLILTEKDGIVDVHLEESLPEFDDKSQVSNLLELLRMYSRVIITNEHPNGNGDNGSSLDLELYNLLKLDKPLIEQLKYIQLYRNLAQTLEQRLSEINKNSFFPQELVDDIEYFAPIGLEASIELSKKYIQVAYFMRELYGIIKIKTNITRDDMISDRKDNGVAKERAIISFILKNRYQLSTVQIGKVLGPVDKPKNHATVIGYLKDFDYSGIKLDFYEIAGPPKLYDDANNRYRHVKKNADNGSNGLSKKDTSPEKQLVFVS